MLKNGGVQPGLKSMIEWCGRGSILSGMSDSFDGILNRLWWWWCHPGYDKTDDEIDDHPDCPDTFGTYAGDFHEGPFIDEFIVNDICHGEDDAYDHP